MKVVALFVSLSYVFLAAESIRACSCDLPAPPCFDYSRNEAVFIGTVRKINAAENASDPFAFETVEISVDESFRGVTTPFVKTYNYGHSCGFQFKPEGSYLFYGLLRKGYEFETSLCSRTTSLKGDL